MKKIVLTLVAVFCASMLANSQVVSAQTSSSDTNTGKKVPSVTLKTVDGKSFNTADLENGGKPIIVSFWALWCKNCIKELTAINDVYADWQEETGVTLYAVSIDDAQRNANVKSFANSKGWDYEILLDSNQDFKRAMNVGNIPHTFVLNGKGEIVWQHTSYMDGAENELFEVVKKVAKGQSVKQ
ncbi:MAG: TlpA disulfide reductase family protein [Bacteroidales bacterium]|nr:TlpA disulfide reductase family protein [Bacteroidales bacterium]